MSRLIALGVASLVLAACNPATEPAAPAEAVSAAPEAATAGAAAPTPAAPAAAAPVEPIAALEARAATCLRVMDAAEAAGALSAEGRAEMRAANCDSLFAEGRALREADPSLGPRLDAALEPLD